MTTVVRLMLLAAPIGALDVLWFHIYELRLYENPESAKEEITHLFRGIMFPTGLALLLVGRPEGLWFVGLLALFAFDFVNSLLDVLFEPASRRPDGVPIPELAVHVVGGTLTTAAATLFISEGWSTRGAATALAAHADGWLAPFEIVIAWGTVIGGGALFVLEAALFARALLSGSGKKDQASSARELNASANGRSS